MGTLQESSWVVRKPGQVVPVSSYPRRFPVADVVTEWLNRNPPPDDWQGTVGEWIREEMPSRWPMLHVLRWWYGILGVRHAR